MMPVVKGQQGKWQTDRVVAVNVAPSRTVLCKMHGQCKHRVVLLLDPIGTTILCVACSRIDFTLPSTQCWDGLNTQHTTLMLQTLSCKSTNPKD